MTTTVKPLHEIVQELPPSAQKMVREFAEALLAKYRIGKGKRLRQDWAGALREYRDEYTALELQKKAMVSAGGRP